MPERLSLESGFLRRRPIFWMALSCCCGIFLDDCVTLPLTVLAALLLVASLAALAAAFHFRRAIFPLGLAFALILGAFSHAAQFRIRPSDDVTHRTPERPCLVWIRGTILEAEWRSSHGHQSTDQRVAWTVELDALGREANAMQRASGRIRVTSKVIARPDKSVADDENDGAPNTPIDLAATLAEGDRVEFRAVIEPLPVATIPDGFDYGSYLAALGIGRVGNVSNATVRKIDAPDWRRIGLRLRRVSGILAANTPALLNGHAEQAGLLNAMVFGRRESLSVSDREAFAISGTAHLLAISGLHIQLVCAALWRVLGCFGIAKRKSAGWVLAACLAYCLLTGSSPPAVRATVMFGAYALASPFQREADPLTALGMAALIVLSYAPHDLFTAGFQLSFLAVLSLHTLLPIFKATWEKWRVQHARLLTSAPGEALEWSERIKQWIVESMLVTLAAWLATSPSVAWHMGRFSALGLFVNLFALPFLSICMAFGTATIVLGYVWPVLGKILGWGAWVSLGALESVNSFCANLPGASIDMPHPLVWTLAAYAALLVWTWVARRGEMSVLRVACVVCACPLLLVANVLFLHRPTTPELTILDLSRGRAALIETSDGAALIDAGGGGQGLRIVELLRRRRIHRLALLVITADQPNAIEGALEIVPRVRIDRVILPRCKFPSETRRTLETMLTEKGIHYGSPTLSAKCVAPDGIEWQFSDDGPPFDKPAANASTLCVRIAYGSFSTLFADAKSGASLGRLLAKKELSMEADVLRIMPGEYNRWPRETVDLIQRSKNSVIIAGTSKNADESSGMEFEALNTWVLSPHQEGSIRIRSNASGPLQLSGYRGEWLPILNDK